MFKECTNLCDGESTFTSIQRRESIALLDLRDDVVNRLVVEALTPIVELVFILAI